MNRTFVYPGELPRVEDFMGFQKQAYYGMGGMIRSAIGTNTGVGIGDFQISATSPASMSVIIGTGSIYAQQIVDTSTFGVLGTDSNVIMKQGLLATPQTLAITPPGTSGFSQYYLVQVGFNETDSNAVVPPFLNSANPSAPWNGANNTGASLPTVRADQAVVSLVAGLAAATGSQTVPSPSAGSTPLWVISVTNGQTQITSTNWFTYAPIFTTGSPWFPNLESLQNYFIPQAPFTDFYVNQSAINASDSNSGEQSQPFLTIQGAINAISGYVANEVNVHVSAGTYTIAAAQTAAFVPKCQVQNWNFIGAGIGVTIINATSTGSEGFVTIGPFVTLQGFTIGSYYSSAQSQNGGVLYCTNIAFTGSSGYTGNAAAAYGGGLIYIFGTINISGNYGTTFVAGTGSLIFGYQDVNITLTATVTYSGVIANGGSGVNVQSIDGGTLSVVGAGSVSTFSGSLTGYKFQAAANGTINTSGAGVNFFPGSIAGVTGSGGQYS